jgi:hypothetical protein
MKLESRKDEQPLSTAALANANEPREPENRAQPVSRDPLPRRDSDAAVREDRPAADTGPALVPPRTTATTGEAGRVESRIERASDSQPASAGKTPDDERNTPLFADHESKDLFGKWDALQVGFIDEPRRAVEQADHLVAMAMKRTAEIFAEERARLERQWDRGDKVSTEDLRIAMRRYRSFFRRLLTL